MKCVNYEGFDSLDFLRRILKAFQVFFVQVKNRQVFKCEESEIQQKANRRIQTDKRFF